MALKGSEIHVTLCVCTFVNACTVLVHTHTYTHSVLCRSSSQSSQKLDRQRAKLLVVVGSSDTTVNVTPDTAANLYTASFDKHFPLFLPRSLLKNISLMQSAKGDRRLKRETKVYR